MQSVLCSVSFFRIVYGLRHVDAAQRQQPLQAGIELFAVLEDESDRFAAVDEA